MFIRLFLILSFATWANANEPERWPTYGWPRNAPESQGLRGELLAQLGEAVRRGEYGKVDRILIIRNGMKVYDEGFRYDYADFFKDFDQTPHQYNYHHHQWHPYFKGRDIHSLQSVTKSVLATVFATAMEQGKIKDVHQPVLPFFEDYNLDGVDPRFQKADLEDVLTMRSGIEWHEMDRPIGPTNSCVQLEASDNWIQFVLDQPMDADPGEKWVYSSGNSQLLSHVIKQATGMHVHEYAEAHLFKTLGIDEYHWKKTPRGYPDTEGGLYLEADQLAKIGYLYLKDGIWDGKRILPKAWVAKATDRLVELKGTQDGYGYQWWRTDREGTIVWAAMGYGGQRLVILPEHQLIAVANGWNIVPGDHKYFYPDLLKTLIQALKPGSQD